VSLETGWPTAVDYTGAAQDPERCFVDPRLQRAVFQENRMGMPVVRSGQMAAVMPVQIDGNRYALRLFTTPVDHGARYRAVNHHLAARPTAPLVHAEWIDEAVAVGDGVYPAVLMPWIDGMLLSSYVEALVEEGRAGELRDLAAAWVHLVGSLRAAGVIHGDLQHGNVMVGTDGMLRLVDYDGVWVPGMQTTLKEAGQPNYQHPQRAEVPEVVAEADTFAAFVIYVSLLAVAADPDLWETFHSGENLIIVREDFLEAGRRGSPIWTALAASPDPDVVRHVDTLQRLCSTDLRTIPLLHDLVERGMDSLGHGVDYVPDRAGHRSGGSWWDVDDDELQSSALIEESDPDAPVWSVADPVVIPLSSDPPVADAPRVSHDRTLMAVAVGLLLLALIVVVIAAGIAMS
jgi:serine/threonine protein kinase